MVWLKRFVIATSFFIAHQASAAIVYDNGGPISATANPLNALIAVGGTNGLYAVADDFTLAHSTVLTDAHFWTIEAQDNSLSSWNGSLTYTILADASGMPGAVLGTGTYAPGLTRTPTALTSLITLGTTSGSGLNNVAANSVAWNFDLSNPLTLGPGNYWFSLILGTVNDTTPSSELYWEATASATASNSTAILRAGSDVGTNVDLAFYLTGDRVPPPLPIPSVLLLLLGGLVGLSLFRKKQSV